MKKLFQLFAVVMFAIGFFAPAQAADLTVNEGTYTDRTIPINIYWLDSPGTRSQVIYPAEQLTDMVGCPITSMKFYLDGDLDASGGTIKVSLGIIDQTLFEENEFFNIDMTTVATISLTSGGTELLIDFDEPFMYNGGNLLLDTYVEEESSDYGTVYFYGVNPYYYSGKSRSQFVNFIPMTTFEYIGADDAASVYPKQIAFKPLRIGNEAEMSVVVKNVGINPFTPSFALEAPFSTTAVAQELLAGETLEIPVKFAPTEEGEFNYVMSIDCGAAGILEVPISGKGLAAADEITVCEPTAYSSALPVYGFYYDYPGGVSQMIYPAEELTEIVGKEIFGIAYSLREPMAMSEGNIQFSLMETEETAFDMNDPVALTGLTVVGNAVPELRSDEFVIYFDNNFTYTGGNLVIETLVTEAGGYGNTYYNGVNTDHQCSYYTYASSWGSYSNTSAFLPTVTFICKKSGGEPPVVVIGDVDGNGEVGIADVTALIDILLGGLEAPAAADCNNDDIVNVSDVTALIDYLLSGAWPE